MDADQATACVEELKRLAHRVAGTTGGTFQDAIDLAEAFTDLHESLRKGGDLPRQWRGASVERVEALALDVDRSIEAERKKEKRVALVSARRSLVTAAEELERARSER